MTVPNLKKLTLWYQVSSASYLGPVRFRTLWQKLGDDIGRIFGMADAQLLELKGAVTKQNLLGIREQADQYNASREFMQKQMDMAAQCGGQILTLDDPCYPQFLRKSKMCHAVIYCIGNLHPFVNYAKAVAVVGTRKAHSDSLRLAEGVAEKLARQGWVIVSGMAKGIDSAAHEGALKARGKTIAVLGCGPDVIYPSEARTLHSQIRERGLVLSEFPFGTKPEDWKLQKRNKTTVALSTAIFVVETGAKGGTMNAVRAAAEQTKPVFTVIPSWPGDFSGNQKAVHNGAVLLDTRDAAQCIATRVQSESARLVAVAREKKNHKCTDSHPESDGKRKKNIDHKQRGHASDGGACEFTKH